MAVGLSITSQAAKRIRDVLAADPKENQEGLRIKIVGGGCSGLQYKFDLGAARQGDRIFEMDGAKVMIDTKSLLYLAGTELDYKEGLMESAFVLQNPNVKKTCGCGVSFAV